MDGLDAARWLTWKTSGLAIAMVLAALGFLAGIYESKAREAWRQQFRAKTAEQLNLLGSDLQGRLDADMQLVRGLVAVISADPDIDAARFHRIGAELLNGWEEAHMITAAPNSVISMIYPEEGNRQALGFDFRTQKSAQALSQRTARNTIDLFGPYEPFAGSEILSMRSGVFVGPEEKFWGIVSLVIEKDALFRVTGFTNEALGIDVAIAPIDGKGQAGPPVLGEPSVLASDPVETEVRLPDGTWRLAAVPKGGWPAPPALWFSRIAFAAAGLALTVLLLVSTRLAISRQRQVGLLRQREAELSRLSWRLDFALASSNVGVWDVDLATDELFWDARTKALFGVEGDSRSIYGLEDWAAILHPDDRARAIEEAEVATLGNGRFSSRYRIVRPDGQIRHISDLARLHEAEDGSRRLVGLVWDVTDEVARQEELELRRVEAESATVAKSRFLASMSHEIRTPMSGVLGVLGLMLDDPLPPHQRERAQIALASAESLLDILNDILDFSKLEAAEVALGEEPVDLRALVAQVTDLMSPNAARKGLSLSHVVSSAVPRLVMADPVRLRQILTNLLSNATKFTERGEIAIRVDYAGTPSGGALSIEVEDTGIGIPPEQHDKIFQRFIQADDSLARSAGGTGLGLAISSQLAELMGGRVTVRSVQGMGSTFRLEIPTCAAMAALPASPFQPHDERDGATPLRVLLAEDHATNQYVIGAYLRGAGHTVTVVSNGAEAVQAARAGDFDVVLMDVQMPVMDGLAAARAIRNLGGPASTVPILALTASAMPGDREACLAAGMTGHLTKPITAAVLHSALGELQLASGSDHDVPRRTGTSA